MTLDERLRGATQEVKDLFEALEPSQLAEPTTLRRSRTRPGPAVAAVAFLAVLIAGAGLLWLGPFGGEDADIAGSVDPPTEACADTFDAAEVIERPLMADAVPRTGCALTAVLNAYFGAWAGQGPDAIESYFQNQVVIVVDGPGSGPESGIHEGDDGRAMIEGWFADGLGTERTGEGGGAGRFHVESTIYTFGSGEPIHAINVLEFSADPFTSARQEESPLVAHHIFLLGDEPTLSATTVVSYLANGGTPQSLASLLVTPTTLAAQTSTTPNTEGAVLTPPMRGCTAEYSEWLSERGRVCDLVRGESVPALFGPLLDGDWFDLKDLRGQPTVVFTWAAYNGQGNRDAIAEFQVLYDKWSGRINFVSISEDTADEALKIIEQGDFTFPVVTCISAPTESGTTILCGPNEEEFLWVWWGNQNFPSWTVLDSEGRFIDIRLGGKTTLEEIDSIIASVVGSQTDSSG